MRTFVAVVAILAVVQIAFGVRLSKSNRLHETIGINLANRAFEDTLNKSLECVRAKLNQGVPEYDLPSFNPLQIKELGVDLDELYIPGHSGSIKVVDLVGEGLTGWQTTALKGTIGLIPPSYTVSLSQNFPRIVIDTRYSLNVSHNDYNLFGSGSLHIEVADFSVKVDLKATILGGVRLEYFHLVPSLSQAVAVNITGIRNDEEYSGRVSEYLLQNASQIIAQNAQKIDEVVGAQVVDAVNNGAGNELIRFLVQECLLG